MICLGGRHISSIRSKLREYAIWIYVGIRCDVDADSDAKVVSSYESLAARRKAQTPDVDKGRCSQSARSFGNHRNSPDDIFTSFISFRSRGLWYVSDLKLSVLTSQHR